MADVLNRARRLGHKVFAPIAANGEAGRLNRPLVLALGEHGLLELVFAGSAVELCELREGLAHGCTEAETALALQGLGGYPILSRGSPAVRENWIPRLSNGEAVAAFALSEPDACSHAASLTLQAKRERDGFRLTGTKLWISNAPEADVDSVFARTGDEGAKGITAFAVPRESEGLSGEHLDLLDARVALAGLAAKVNAAGRDDCVREADRLGQLGRVDDHRPRHAGTLPSDQAA